MRIPRHDRGTYKVGKGRPPRSTRFKPGQSGNPRGRPKGAKSLATILHDTLNQKIEVRVKGKIRKVTALEGIAMKFVQQALKGDIKAIALLLAKQPEIAKTMVPLKMITANMSLKEATDIYMQAANSSYEEIRQMNT
jgi:Family of unknown function (DUF5681)